MLDCIQRYYKQSHILQAAFAEHSEQVLSCRPLFKNTTRALFLNRCEEGELLSNPVLVDIRPQRSVSPCSGYSPRVVTASMS
jgi:hypothetical protein